MRNPKKIVTDGYERIVETHQAWAHEVRAAERLRYTSLIIDSLPSGGDLLELGCATASVTTPQLARHFKLTGVDISPRQIEIARQQMPDSTFICGDITKIDFAQESFDAMVAFYSIIHVPRNEQPLLLKNISSWMKPGGLFVASFTATATEAGYDDDRLGAPMYWSGFDSKTNVSLVENIGLDILSAVEETDDEFDHPIMFLWIVARK